ncbi:MULTISPECIES: GGDEF domain-containing protein [unclassified Marinobacter]|uniref:GGDEF domain-containing protein n=1 Tax=unclassified Marinobacter TaxID=83889 RepID=UPI001268DA28|nr:MULTISPECIES: GGDEF domain-containing protein [unclassified Marinobacter]QFS89003.1 Cyclic di-GMP phosphodiesterase Gmr [Marinobacter sp. THAF197a]QFT52788.1 Cyclic di-GMP phosphodiesterase Gmr [Marinobacter sp. THAF39]
MRSLTIDRKNPPDSTLGALATRALARPGAPIPTSLSIRFADYVDTKTRPYIHAVIVIGAIGYFLFALGDLVVARDVFWSSLLLRAVFLAAVLGLTQWMVVKAQNIYLLEAVGALYVHVAAVIWYSVLFRSSGPEVGVYAFASVIFVLWLNIGSSARFSTAVISSCTLTALVLGGVWWLNQGEWMRVFIYASLHASVLVFGLVISWYNSFNQRRLFLYGVIDEVKNLELKEANRLLWSQAHTDPLTGLPNRSLLFDRLTQALASAHREQKRVGLLYVDLDQFKPVNDTYGHAAGDQVLQAAASRMSAIVRASDTVARVGGDEFVVVLPGLRDDSNAMSKAAEIIKTLAEPFRVDSADITIGCSVGIAMFPEHGEDADQLQQVADRAVYEAKGAGRNCARMGIGSSDLP